jgi:hypothetical protein
LPYLGSPGHQPTAISWASIALRMMKSFEGGCSRTSRKEADGEVERAPPCVDRGRASTIRSTELGQDEGGLGRCRQIGGDLRGVVVGVDIVLVEWHGPGDLLGFWVDVDPADELADGVEGLAGDRAHRTIGSQRNAAAAPGTRLDGQLVILQIERHDEAPGAARGRQRGRLPPARRQPQRRMLELRLGWCERHRKLAEELGMRVQGVAGLRPGLVGNLAPLRRHARRLLNHGRAPHWAGPTGQVGDGRTRTKAHGGT